MLSNIINLILGQQMLRRGARGSDGEHKVE